jgi:hypothetical protein
MARDWWRVVLAAAVVTLGALSVLGGHADAAKRPRKQDVAEAQRAIESAAKLLKAGKVDRAVESLSATLAGGNLPPAMLAKAFYVRGMAYREQKKPAQAISDLTSALWLRGGLGGEERADALRQRAAAYADAGLTERGGALAPAGAERPPAKKADSNWLSSIFGAPASPAPPVPGRPKVAAAATAKTETPTVAKAPLAIGGWAGKTEVQVNRKTLAAPAAVKPPESEPPAAEAEPAPARAEGRFQVQVATVRTKAEALALAAKAKREHHAVLAASEPVIDHAILGNMGSFYRVRFGPFTSAEQTESICAKLQGSGLDCMPVSR